MEFATWIIGFAATAYTAVQTWFSLVERERGSPRLTVSLVPTSVKSLAELTVGNVGGSPAIVVEMAVRGMSDSKGGAALFCDVLGKDASTTRRISIDQGGAVSVSISYAEADGRKWCAVRRFKVIDGLYRLTDMSDERMTSLPQRAKYLFSPSWKWLPDKK